MCSPCSTSRRFGLRRGADGHPDALARSGAARGGPGLRGQGRRSRLLEAARGGVDARLVALGPTSVAGVCEDQRVCAGARDPRVARHSLRSILLGPAASPRSRLLCHCQLLRLEDGIQCHPTGATDGSLALSEQLTALILARSRAKAEASRPRGRVGAATRPAGPVAPRSRFGKAADRTGRAAAPVRQGDRPPRPRARRGRDILFTVTGICFSGGGNLFLRCSVRPPKGAG